MSPFPVWNENKSKEKKSYLVKDYNYNLGQQYYP